MAEQDNVRIARESWDAWNAHDIEGALKILDAKHVWETDTLPHPSLAVMATGRRCRCTSPHSRTFTSASISCCQAVTFVVTRYTATGTHNGDLMGILPTKRRAEVHGCTVMEVRNSTVVRSFVYWDTGHLLRQLGVMPG